LKKKPDGSSVERIGGLPDEKIRQAVQVLRQGGIVAFPTETYSAGRRSAMKPSLRACFRSEQAAQATVLLIHDIFLLDRLVTAVPDVYLPLIEKFWPSHSPDLSARPHLSAWLTGGTGTVGVRISRNRAWLWGGSSAGPVATRRQSLRPPPSRIASSLLLSARQSISSSMAAKPWRPCSTVVGYRM
jgi:hypothetical protein